MSETNKKHEDLANKFAKLFKDEDNLKSYLYIVKHYKESAVNRAYEETMKVPNDKIKKSRSALFFYLVKKYDKEEAKDL